MFLELDFFSFWPHVTQNVYRLRESVNIKFLLTVMWGVILIDTDGAGATTLECVRLPKIPRFLIDIAMKTASFFSIF